MVGLADMSESDLVMRIKKDYDVLIAGRGVEKADIYELCILLFDCIPASWKTDLVVCVERLLHILRGVLESKLKELEDAAGVVGADLMANAMARAQLMEVYDWMKGELVDEFLGVLNVAPQKKMGFAERIRGLFRCCMTVDIVSQRPAFGSVSANVAVAGAAVVSASGTGLDDSVAAALDAAPAVMTGAVVDVVADAVVADAVVADAVVADAVVATETPADDAAPADETSPEAVVAAPADETAPEAVVAAPAAPSPEREPAHPAGIPLV